MILTNNPSVSDFLEKPKNNICRVYLVNVIGEIPNGFLASIKKTFHRWSNISTFPVRYFK